MDPREENSIKYKILSQEAASMNPLLSLYLLMYSAEFLTNLSKELDSKNDPRKQQMHTQLLNMINQIEALKVQNSQAKEQAKQELGQYILQGISQTQAALEKGTNPNDLIPWFNTFLSYIEMMENLQNLDPKLAQQRAQILSTLSKIKEIQQHPEQTPGFSHYKNNLNKSSVLQNNNKTNNNQSTYQEKQDNLPQKQQDQSSEIKLIYDPDDSDENIDDEYDEDNQRSLPNSIQISQQIKLLQPKESIFNIKDNQRTVMDAKVAKSTFENSQLNLKPPSTPPLQSNVNINQANKQNENNYFFNNNNNTILPSNNNFDNPNYEGDSMSDLISNPIGQSSQIRSGLIQQPKAIIIPPNQLPAQQVNNLPNPKEKGKVKLMAIRKIEQIINQIRNGNSNAQIREQLSETIRLLDSV